jgi:hypothetical protein
MVLRTEAPPRPLATERRLAESQASWGKTLIHCSRMRPGRETKCRITDIVDPAANSFPWHEEVTLWSDLAGSHFSL